MENVKFSIKIQFFKNSLIFIWDISVDLIFNGSVSPPPHPPTFSILSLNIIVTYLANDRINKKHKLTQTSEQTSKLVSGGHRHSLSGS